MKLLSKAGLAAVFLGAALALSGCGVSTSSNVNFDADDIAYDVDSRTGLCYAFTASRKAMQMDTSGLGLTNVPCTDEVLEQVDQGKLDTMQSRGIQPHR